MSEVVERGATRWARPSDYSRGPIQTLPRNPNPPPGNYRPNPKAPRKPVAPKPGQPGYEPRVPRTAPGEKVRPNGKPMYPGFGASSQADMLRGLARAASFMAGGRIGMFLKGMEIAMMLDEMYPPLHYVKSEAFPAAYWTHSVQNCGIAHEPHNWVSATVRTGCTNAANRTTSFAPLVGPVTSSAALSCYKVMPGSIAGLSNYRDIGFYTRKSGAPVPTPTVVNTTVAPASMLNPNVARVLPSTRPLPWVNPAAHPEAAVKSASEVATDTAAATSTDAYAKADPRPAYARQVGRAVAFARPRGPGVRVRPEVRLPPRKNERHTKSQSASAKFLAALFGVLDEVSEKAEIIDAVYDALPDKTKKRWDCGGSRGLIDNAGQYGIDKADCKAKAIWHNWNAVDVETAVENIIKNHIQDKIVGGIQSKLPRNWGSAGEAGEIAFNKWLNGVLDEIVNFGPR